MGCHAFIAVAALLSGQQSEHQRPAYDMRCGSYCLYVALKAFEYPVESFDNLESKLGQPSAAGYSLGQLQQAAQSFGARTLAVETSIENLKRRPGRFACLTLIDQAHFVLLADLKDDKAWIVDPPNAHWIPLDTFRSRWSRKALLISNRPLVAEEDLPGPFPWKLAIACVCLVVLIVTTVAVRRKAKHPADA